ncbi:MAG: vitamin K epoxide reductase family protein [Acidobacteria bacterium]|nr:vitamin K epoxide reductase family protein [Acidobacteriota bacterium]
MWCPLLADGCQAVADAPFAHPYDIPDGYIGAALYGVILALLFVPHGRRWAWIALVALGVFATYANVKGVYDMAKLGAFCTYCVFATATAPLLLWLIWRVR